MITFTLYYYNRTHVNHVHVNLKNPYQRNSSENFHVPFLSRVFIQTTVYTRICTVSNYGCTL